MNVVAMREPAIALAKLSCEKCGAETEAACGCGVAYRPAGERAAEAVAANPERSDRAIAAQIGVGHKTVSRARSTVSRDTVAGAATSVPAEPAKRQGLDGKLRSMPQRSRHDVKVEKQNAINTLLIHASSALDLVRMFRIARKKAQPTDTETDEVIDLVKRTTRAWLRLHRDLRSSYAFGTLTDDKLIDHCRAELRDVVVSYELDVGPEHRDRLFQAAAAAIADAKAAGAAEG